MSDAPTPHELARDLDQLERQWSTRLTVIETQLDKITRNTTDILSEQARSRQEGSDHARRIGRLETDQTNNRRMVVGSLIFPILVVFVGALLASGGVP